MNVVITGGTKGMGYAIADAFAKEGANIAITARTSVDLVRTQQELAKAYPSAQILTFPADMSKEANIQAFAEKIKNTWGSVDVLVNNAGLFLTGDMMEEPESSLEKMMEVNLFGPVRLTRHLYDALKKSEGAHVFNVCSVASQKYFPNGGSYGVTKYALLGYTRALREEWRERGIKVTAVLPGATHTRSWEGSNIDPQRLMQPEDIGQAIVSTWKIGDTALIEELVMRPPLGDV